MPIHFDNFPIGQNLVDQQCPVHGDPSPWLAAVVVYWNIKEYMLFFLIKFLLNSLMAYFEFIK